MCLAVPGKIISIGDDHRAVADFGGVTRPVQLDLMPGLRRGDYVLVHAGFAIQKLRPRDARAVYKALREADIQP